VHCSIFVSDSSLLKCVCWSVSCSVFVSDSCLLMLCVDVCIAQFLYRTINFR
jgi:hypothetical protein